MRCAGSIEIVYIIDYVKKSCFMGLVASGVWYAGGAQSAAIKDVGVGNMCIHRRI